MNMRDRRRGRGLRTVAAASGLIMAGATAVAVASPAQAVECAAVQYTVVNSWGGGYQANVSIVAGDDAIDGWTLEFDLPQGVSVSQAWNADVNQSGASVTASDVGWNASIPAGTTREAFGAIVSGSADTVPATFRLNGEVCGGEPTQQPTETPTETPTEPPGGGTPGENPDWGQALPPEGVELSRAYEIITEGDKYDPRAGECSKDVHARYWTYGPDGEVYPTWHPTEDPSGCYFGHEHGDDPRDSGSMYDQHGWPAFGYTSEVMRESTPDSSQRHEDHVGHKIVADTNIRAIQGDDGSALFPPQGSSLATCDLMIKYHQGTHSPDAFTNNVHEVFLDQRCQRSNGQTFETSYKAMVPFGDPGTFSTHDCPGPFLSRTINAGAPTPPDSIDDPGSIGRLITAEDCAQAIRDGELRYDPISGGQVPLDSDQMHEFWFGTGAINGAGVSFEMSPLLYSLRPSRYYDPSQPNNLGRQIDLCSDPQIGGEPCELVRQRGGNIAWDSPDSPFNGALRDIRVGGFSQSAGGSVTIYTDAYGRNASTSPFEGSIEQYFSGNSGDGIYIRAALRDWTAPGVHAPN